MKRLRYDRAIYAYLEQNEKITVPEGEVWKCFVSGSKWGNGTPNFIASGVIIGSDAYTSVLGIAFKEVV